VVIRLAKTAIVAALAAFCAHGRFNVFDYDSNYQFVRHVLSMDTIFPDSTLRSRAIDSETMWRAAYALIIAAEALCGLLLALGAAALLLRLWAPAKSFNRAKSLAVAGSDSACGFSDSL
jgi:predicted small integral membrane protein